MKILIIGKNSYIGNHIDEWLTAKGNIVCQLDVLNDCWQTFDYSQYDSIIHVAGIVHRPDCTDWDLFKRVNTDMPIAIATMAKQQGVKLYVFFSTMGVYNAQKKISGCVIDEQTQLNYNCNSMYGKSKLLAEDGLKDLQDDDFDVAVVRPPSVYGKDCKGGYINSFKRIAQRLPLLPYAYEDALQSFIYIDNLCECINIIIENRLRGVFCPQDNEIPNANRLLQAICDGIEKKYRPSKLLGVCLRILSCCSLVTKAYGGISYARTLSDIVGYNYIVVPFEEAIRRTVRK